MDLLEESALLPAEEDGVKVQDTEWNVCQIPDRSHADALLNISEDSLAKEENAYELSNESGWEEAVQGWGRSSPLACLFQMQKKSKKNKASDSAYHCLLCVDVKLLKNTESDHSTHSVFESDGNCSSYKHHHCGGSKPPLLYLKRPSNMPPSTAEHQTFSEAMRQALCGDKAFLGASQLTLVEPFTESANTHPLDKQCAKVTERDRNASTIINSFSVLPPVKAEGASEPRSPGLVERTEATSNQSSAHSISEGGRSPDMLGGGEGAGVEKICELMKQAGMDSHVPGASYAAFPPQHPGLSGLPWPSQPSKHSQFALSIQNSKKHDQPLNLTGDLFPRTGYRLVRNVKCEDVSRVSIKNSHGHKFLIALKPKSTTKTNAQLPALLGTRVPLPASSHRLL